MDKKIKFFLDNFWEVLFSFPKTIWFNFRVLSFKNAIRLPFMVSWHIKLRGISKKTFIVKEQKMRFASSRIGFGGSECGRNCSKSGEIVISNGGKIILAGNCGLSKGVFIESNNSEILLGKNFRCNYSSSIYCKDSSISFGNDVVLGWKVTIRNGDGHAVIVNGNKHEMSKPISIGNHVWICSFVHILKGVKIGDDSVVAYGSIVTKGFDLTQVLIGGYPAKVLSNNTNWVE